MLINYLKADKLVFLIVIALFITGIIFLQKSTVKADEKSGAQAGEAVKIVNDTNLSLENIRSGLQLLKDSDNERNFGNNFRSNQFYNQGSSLLNKELIAGKNINFKNYKLKLVRTDDIHNSYLVCDEIEGLELVFEFGRENGADFWINKKDFTDKSFIKLLEGSKAGIFTGTLQVVFAQPKLRNTGTYYNYYYNKDNGKFGLTISCKIIDLHE